MESFRSGFVGLVGPTNSGKSTLMNALLGRKLSIVSPRAQTTYHGIRGIQTKEREQIIYVDTPGFQRNPDRIARLLNKVADKNAKDCDFLVWVFDVSNPKAFSQIMQLKERISNKPIEKTFCILNKVDKVAKGDLLPLLQKIHELGVFSEIIPVSALKKDGVDRLAKLLSPMMPEGMPWYSPEDKTDRSQDFVLSEFIREKVYTATRQEVPYTVRVEMENWPEEKQPDRVPTYHAIIWVDSESRRGILIGKQGEMLKRIGTAARQDIEGYLGHQVCLKLFVRVQPHWRDDARALNKYLELET
ncbi:GTPase Era [bacterium]|nr:GTPase Era [bacterium]